jgi:DNA-directed RNA polymerase specialized sigma24 family protein
LGIDQNRVYRYLKNHPEERKARDTTRARNRRTEHENILDRYKQGKTAREIAKELKMRTGKVWYHIYKGRRLQKADVVTHRTNHRISQTVQPILYESSLADRIWDTLADQEKRNLIIRFIQEK